MKMEEKRYSRTKIRKKLYIGGLVGLTVSAIVASGSLEMLHKQNSVLNYLENLKYKDESSLVYTSSIEKDQNLMKKVYYGATGGIILSAFLSFLGFAEPTQIMKRKKV